MGVRGIRHLLKDVGWLPNDDDGKEALQSSCGCSGSIWREWNASDAFLGQAGPPLEKIPSDAEFLIDGNGLAFYLHSIAYTRHLRSITGRSGCPTTQEILTKAEWTIQALPCMLRLHLLRTVTNEFVTGLQESGVGKIVVFWDGPARRAKSNTDRKRKMERDQQESYLELFCSLGSVISASKKKRRTYACQWKEDFPFSKLFLTCVRHALHIGSKEGFTVDNVECSEEADIELALQASGNDKAYVLAMDSDFFFYKAIQYIPLNQISIQHPSGLHAFVARRSALARLLGFDDDARLIDLAMLMGNDYVDTSSSLTLPHGVDPCNVQSMVYHLQCHPDYETIPKSEEGQKATVFVRSLYQLKSLEDFPLTINGLLVEENDGILARDTDEAKLLPEEPFVRDGILRYLRCILDQNDGTDAKFPLTEQALQAFELSSSIVERHEAPNLQTRPTYKDMKAASFIERCIARFYRSSMNTSLLIRATPPDVLLSRMHFFAALSSLRPDETKEERMEENPIEPTVEEPLRLPIDEHEESILQNIRENRVTIIHGETGCGKSSRVPVMLLKSPPPDGSLRKVRFFISQPRRIAAKALVERVRSCEPELREKFALRMGHGWKEYETKDTQAYFVTTGYLVRLLANHPERFDDCTHLVIDEVHERSVDTDILCLLCRRLLQTNKTIRLVLMSATLATKMYRDYFGVLNEPIHVGVRRYPITEYFVEDLPQFGLPKKESEAALAILHENETKKCVTAPTSSEMKWRFGLAARLASMVGEPGSSVLIFVPGMAEIIAISELVEGFHTPGVRYTCFPIHGDIPFEEQMDAFHAPKEDEVKIIIATNAAESSVTLPNVDHVICLGLCRQIVYNQASHRQMLTAAWISRASATQRAGRTGRVRPGNVYRLYTRRAYDSYMEEFEPGEMVRIPLDSVILMLKQILHEEVIPVFMECLEPPPLNTIDRSFQSLYRWNFITEPGDEADITSLGTFVSALGVDLSLGSFIGLGIQFGVAAEAIEMAAMMSLPKTPFQITSPMWLSPGQFNENASRTYSSKCKFDSGSYSEPLGLMNALWDFFGVSTSKKNNWCYNNNFAIKRWQQAVSSRNSLRKRVADFLGIHEEKLHVQLPPRDMPLEKVLILRLLKVWVFSDSIIECSPSKLKLKHDGSVTLSVKSRSKMKLNESHLTGILPPERYPFSITEQNEIEQTGVFEEEGEFSFLDFVKKFENRLVSFSSEMGIDGALCYSDEALYFYIEKSKICEGEIQTFLESISDVSTQQDYFAFELNHKNRRGIQERPSGSWTIQNSSSNDLPVARQKAFLRIEVKRSESGVRFPGICAFVIHETHKLKSKLIWYFFTQNGNKKKKKASTTQPFWVQTFGECRKLSKQDLEDLLGRKPLSVSVNNKNSSQSIVVRSFKPTDSLSSNEPLFVDIPEGARILALLASSQRKGSHSLRIPRSFSDLDCEETYDFSMKEEEIDVSKRWVRLNSPFPVYVDDSVPSTAIHTSTNLYAVAANALELQRGGMRVDSLTLLPPNPIFLVLSFMSFGLEINTPSLWEIPNDDLGTTKKINKAYAWLKDRSTKLFKDKSKGGDQIVISAKQVPSEDQSHDIVWGEKELKDKLKKADDFNETSMGMGEKLVCFPDRIRELCKLFDGFDGYNLSPWDSILEESLTEENLRKWRQERKSSKSEGDGTPSRVNAKTVKNQSVASNGKTPKVVSSSRDKDARPTAMKKSASAVSLEPKFSPLKNEMKISRGKKIEYHAIRHFDDKIIASSSAWFSTTLGEGEAMPSFPSTNILALLFQLFEAHLPTESVPARQTSKFKILLNTANWDVARFHRKGEKALYRAYFINTCIPTLPVLGRGKNKLPKWIKKNRGRPCTVKDAKECVPPNVKCPNIIESDGEGLVFESIEDALKMEAAFWLNKQFCHAGKTAVRQWYSHSLEKMIQILTKYHNSSLSRTENDMQG